MAHPRQVRVTSNTLLSSDLHSSREAKGGTISQTRQHQVRPWDRSDRSGGRGVFVEDTESVNFAKVGALRDGLDAVRVEQQQKNNQSSTTTTRYNQQQPLRTHGSPQRSFSPSGGRGGETKYRALPASGGTTSGHANNIGGGSLGHRGAAPAAYSSNQPQHHNNNHNQQQRFVSGPGHQQGTKTDLQARQAGAAVGVVTGSASASGVGNPANSQSTSGSSSPAPVAAAPARWVPPSLLPKHLLSTKAKDDAIHRQVRSILNKLTPEKFQPLSDELLKIYYEAPHILNGVVVLIFEKALDEPKYSSMYAQLCKRLSDSVSQFEGGKGGAVQQTFLDVLSKVCWEKFENRFKYYEVGGQGPVNGQEAVLTADEEERQHVVKQKMLGNLKFIGELYLLGQLDDPIIHNCVLQLLGNDKVSADLQVRESKFYSKGKLTVKNNKNVKCQL